MNSRVRSKLAFFYKKSKYGWLYGSLLTKHPWWLFELELRYYR